MSVKSWLNSSLLVIWILVTSILLLVTSSSSCQWIVCVIQGVSLATEHGISLIILTPMKILQRNLNRSTFVVWEMKRNVSVVCVCSAPNCCDTEQRSASQPEMPGSVESEIHCRVPFIIWVCYNAVSIKQTRNWHVFQIYRLFQLVSNTRGN